MTVDKERLEQKLGEAIGFAQKAVEELLSKGILCMPKWHAPTFCSLTINIKINKTLRRNK